MTLRQQSDSELRLRTIIAKRRELVDAARAEGRTLTRAETTRLVRLGREAQNIIEVLSRPVTRVPPISAETQRQMHEALKDAGWK